jgi:hypothetical protein
MSKQASLLWDYRDLAMRRGAGVFPPPAIAAAAAVGGTAAPAAPTNALSRMALLDGEFRAYIQAESYESLRIAQLLLTEMHQDFYPPLLVAAAAKTPPALEMHAAPSPVQTLVPTALSLRFERAELNETAALREWTCSWDFGDNTDPEKGWDVYHCFLKKDNYVVTASLMDLQGNPIVTGQPIKRTIEVVDSTPAKKRGFRIPTITPEAKVEAMQLAFVLAIALSGLYATARGKVETLDGPTAVLAVIAIGFGADTLKNLLTQKPGQQ